MPFERQLLISVLVAGLPGVALAEILLWTGHYSLDHKLEGTVLVLLLWISLSFITRADSVDSIRVISNVVSAVKSEDFSFRAAQTSGGDALGELAIEVNSLAQALEVAKLRAMESANLLRQVMSEAEAVILAFSWDGRLRLVNRAGAIFLGGTEESLLNRHANELGVGNLLEGPPAETISSPEYVSNKRWIVRRTGFRQHGVPHQLIVLSEASAFLRAEERLAWQRIIRVFSHEINNSLAPIKTIARTLARMPFVNDLPGPVAESLTHSLGVIENRAESLNRFLESYTQLAKLPPPTLRGVPLAGLVSQMALLETRLPVVVQAGPHIQVRVDPDQMQQALINLVQNAVDAVLQAGRMSVPDAVVLSWAMEATTIVIHINDKGVGLPATENLFVPFYTTKEGGSGIGLALSRQIVEAHNGTLILSNRPDSPGCTVQIHLPISVLIRDGGDADLVLFEQQP